MLETERQEIATTVSKLMTLTPGRTGNLSVRRDDRMAITPSGVSYESISKKDIPVVSLDGTRVFGEHSPSSESPMHRHIYDRFETGSIVHVHSPWVTTLAVLRQPLPPVHYMIALAGETIPVADYATYGTEELAKNVVKAMKNAQSTACILANHGLVATADDISAAIELAEGIESIARVYCQASAIGAPSELDSNEISRIARKLDSYGPNER